MKKILVIAFIAITMMANAVGENDDTMQRFSNLIQLQQETQQQIGQAFKKKDYPQVTDLCLQAIKTVDDNHDLLAQIIGSSRQINALKGDFYYNLACASSRQGKTEEAFQYLHQAIDCDYNNWKHMLKDKDLKPLRNDARFNTFIEQIKARTDYLTILKNAASYTPNERTDTLPVFTYQPASDANLQRVKAYFNLDSVAGNGDEISKIKNVMTHIHNLIKHDGNHGNPEHVNAIDMAEACKEGSRGLNCRGLAIVLNECYLAMGIPSRYVTCMPKDYINDCHVINAVWSSQYNKWLWIDPEHNAWVTDIQGNMLSIQEVRDYLRNGTPVSVNKKANWNNREKTTTKEYLYNYMAKNLYYVYVSINQEYGLEDYAVPNTTHMVSLMPTGFTSDHAHGLAVNDDNWFWQPPQ